MGIKTLRGISGYCFLLMLFSYTYAGAQNIEFGVYGGISNYIGDVSEQKQKWEESHPSFGVVGRYNISPKVTFKAMVGYGKVSGDDRKADEAANRVRNTNFWSDIYEFSVHMEYNLVKNNLGTRGGKPFVPYLFGGIGIFHFNPKTMYQGKEYELQPLGTEGQGTTVYNDKKKYNLTTICVPVGIGIKKRVSRSFSVGIEAGYRFTTTNYLDDIGGRYADANVVQKSYGVVAGALANRTVEVVADPALMAREGDRRTTLAGLVQNDMYFIAGISICYIFNLKGGICPNLTR